MKHQPAEPVLPTSSPWPVTKWGMDLHRGETTNCTRQHSPRTGCDLLHLKRNILTVTSHVRSFMKRNILTRFGVLSEIVWDKGIQLVSNKMNIFCARYNITLNSGETKTYASITYEATQHSSYAMTIMFPYQISLLSFGTILYKLYVQWRSITFQALLQEQTYEQ